MPATSLLSRVRSMPAAGVAAYAALLPVLLLTRPRGAGLVLFAIMTVAPIVLLARVPVTALGLMLVTYVAGVLAWQSIPVAVLQLLVIDVAVGVVTATRPRPVRLGAVAVTLVVQVCSFARFTHETIFFVAAMLGAMLVMLAAWAFGDSTRQSREAARRLRAQVVVAEVTAERLRIARELHDMVAHSIGIIAIQAGVGARVIDTQPEEARKALDTIETTSRQTLAALRRTVSGLRRPDAGPDAPRDPAPGLADLDRLAAVTAHGGLRVDLRWGGERRSLPGEIELSAYRIVQEALTNVVRHAGVRECRVAVDFRDEELVVTVDDDGRGGVPADTGFGLIGMRERVELLHGAFSAGPRLSGGFRVSARLPVPAPVAVP